MIGGGQAVASSPDSDAIIWIYRKPAYLKDFLRVNGVPDAFETWVNTGSIKASRPTAVSSSGAEPRPMASAATRGPRLELRNALSRLISPAGALGLLFLCQRAEAPSWEASAFAG